MSQPKAPDRYYLSTERRRALWHNEMNMFIVLTLPLIADAFWYGATIQVLDSAGHVLTPSSVGRGVGLALFLELFAVVCGALYLFVQPAVERVNNAQPVRGQRRLAYAAFVGLLVGLITSQSLPGFHVQDDVAGNAISIAVAAAAGLIAYLAMLSMVDIARDPNPASAEPDWVRGAR